MAARLGDGVWTDLVDAPVLVVVPIGSCEQHGPHLPLDTDTRIAVALATELANALTPPGATPGVASATPAAMVAPAISITASGEHQGFPGTLSIGEAVTEAVIVELLRSADWSAGVVLVNGHGGNAGAVGRAVARTRADGRRVHSWWPRVPGGDAHAGRTETSLMLAIEPSVVRLGDAVAGRAEPIGVLIDDLRTHGVRAVSPTGVLGDPLAASADEGRALLASLTDDLVRSTRSWWNVAAQPATRSPAHPA